jgi:hypothetical protein
MFLPKIMETQLNLPSHFISYLIGISIMIGIYLIQKARVKAQVAVA